MNSQPDQIFRWSKCLQGSGETLWNHEVRSQAVIFELMMELEDVGRNAQKRPFRADFFRSPTEEATVVHVLLGQGEGAFRLYGAVNAKQLALRGIDLRFHSLPLGGEAFGNVDDLTALLQWRLAAAGPDALLFERAALAMIADIDRSRNLQSVGRPGVLVMVVADRLARRADVGIACRIVSHVFPPTDVCPVLFFFRAS